jgi:hypothetical protein
MTASRRQSWRPFLSVLIITVTLFTIVFVHMEIRRMGYALLNLAQTEREARDLHRERSVRYAELTGPQHLRRMAQARLDVKAATQGQIIQMTGDRLVVTH